jgi:cytochrome c553
MTAPVKPPTVPAVRSRMLEHYYSVVMMSMGLQAPSDELWKRGAETMRDAQVMKVTLKDETLTADLNAAEAKYREIGATALAAKTPAERAAAFGQVLTSCGGCHALHGRVFGPGLPKM